MSYSHKTSDYIVYDGNDKIRLIKWKIGKGTRLSKGKILFVYSFQEKELKFKSNCFGTVTDLLIVENSFVEKGNELVKYEKCLHPTIMKDLCAECGQDLRQLGNFIYLIFFESIFTFIFSTSFTCIISVFCFIFSYFDQQ